MTQAEELIAKIGTPYVNDIEKQCRHTSYSLLRRAVYFNEAERFLENGRRIIYRFRDGSRIWRFPSDGDLRLL